MKGMARGWKQFECKGCGGIASAKIKSICGITELCETCARKKVLDIPEVCFTCAFKKICQEVTRTCLKHQHINKVMIMDYDKEEVLKAIVSLAQKQRAPIVGNRDIYEVVTGLERYSRKRWELLKPALCLLAKQLEHAVDGKMYVISTYQPMFAGHFNFYVDEGRDRPVAGFQVFEKR